MDDDDLKAFEQREVREDARREKESREARGSATLDAVQGPLDGYDDSGYQISD